MIVWGRRSPRRPFLNGGGQTITAKQVAGASADPVYAAIERHRAADAAPDAARREAGQDAEGDDAAAAVLIVLARIVPTTPAGVLTDLDYVLSLKIRGADGEYVWRVDAEEVDFPWELLRSLHTAMARLV